jgi:serine/threonine-protein kinase
LEARDTTSESEGKAPSPSQSVPDTLVGRVINERYRVVSLLARGGMGRVYRAEQSPLGRAVALKVLHPNYKGEHDPEFHKRFFLEAATCAKLTHPNTVTIFDYGRSDDDVYFIAMELLEGRTLHRALRDDVVIEPTRALHITRQICRSLREAHAIHIVHRDLKPANIFLIEHDDDADFVKVLDFGLVKNTEDTTEDLTQTGLFMGSPKYMAPEQIQGERADGRVDIYALGVMLYEMLVGKVPFDRPNSVNILMAHVHEAPPPFAKINPAVNISPALEAVVMKCMAKNPTERFPSMDELLKALKIVGDAEMHSYTGSRELPLPPDAMSRGTPNPDVSSPNLTPSHVTGVPKLRPQDPTPTAFSAPPMNSGLASGEMSVPMSGPLMRPDASGSTVLPAPAAATSPKWLWPFVALVLALALGAVAFVVMQRPPQTAVTTNPTTDPTTQLPATDPATDPTPTTNPTTDPVNPTTDPTQPEVPVAAPVTLTLTSTPSGALVRVGEHRAGPTPTELVLTPEEAAQGSELEVVFSLNGFVPQTVRRTVEGESLAVDARLARRPSDAAGMMESMMEPAHVEGYRDDPY